MPADAPPPTGPVSLAPEAKLARNVREICRRIVRGKAAAGNASVRWHLILRIVSIILSSLGGVGVIADKASGNLPGETGWAFWGSVVLLVFGILSQIANELQVAQLAVDSRSLAERCALCETQLENILIFDDPRQPVVELLLNMNAVFAGERYNRVLPDMTEAMEAESERSAERLLSRYAAHWQLGVRPQRSKGRPPAKPGPSDPTGGDNS